MMDAATRQAEEIMQGALELAERKVPLAEMSGYLDMEAHKLEGEERARIIAGIITEPHWENIERVMYLLAVKKFIDQCCETPAKVADWLRRRDG